MERRLHQPALAQVEGPFAGQQALAERLLGALEGPALGERGGVGHQHVLDAGRVAHQEDALRAEHELDHRAARGQVLQELQRIAAEASQAGPGLEELRAEGHVAILWDPGGGRARLSRHMRLSNLAYPALVAALANVSAAVTETQAPPAAAAVLSPGPSAARRPATEQEFDAYFQQVKNWGAGARTTSSARSIW